MRAAVTVRELAALLILTAAPPAAVRAQTGAPVRAPAISAPAPPVSALPVSALAVLRGDEWREWWRSSGAPARWTGPDADVSDAVHWRDAAPGLRWGELRLAGTGEAWRLRVIVARVDPRQLRLELHTANDGKGGAGPWTVDSAPASALLALNAGQFGRAGPWGWVVRAGRELRPPGAGPLAPAVAVDRSGRVRFIPPDSLELARRSGEIVEAFQSYPTLLAGGEIPLPLRAAGRGVSVAHRDSRLALGVHPDGSVLIAITRFEGLGGALSSLPFGPTAPEMAALMGALGCRDAVLLDGGISGQLLLRGPGASPAAQAWRGIRRVPLGLVALPRGG